MTDSLIKPVCGGKFASPITPYTNQVILEKKGIAIVFSKTQEGFGKTFNWNEMDLTGLHFGSSAGENIEYFISIQPGCWLSKKLNNEKCAIEIQAIDGKQIVIRSFAILNDDGSTKQNLPECYQGFVNKTWRNQNKLCFYLRKTCALTIKI